MRRPVDENVVRAFLRSFGEAAKEESRVYFTGGVSAVLLGWRSTTVDLDILVIPEQDALFRAIPRLKESLQLNVELASPADFIPELPGWQKRSLFIAKERKLSFFHYDFYSQALSKVQRAHSKDVDDVQQMLRRELIEPQRALELFGIIEAELYRFPAIDPPSFKARVEATFASRNS